MTRLEQALELVAMLARMNVRQPSEDAEIEALDTVNRLIVEARRALGLNEHSDSDEQED